MIVVVGRPLLVPAADGRPAVAGGLAVAIARAAASGGAIVQLAGNVGVDPDGDALLVDLARSGIGHAAVLRDPARPTSRATQSIDDGAAEANLGAALSGELEGLARAPIGDEPAIDPMDLDLALRYLGSFNVLVIGDRLEMAALAVGAEAAEYAGAQLVVVAPSGGPPATGDQPAALIASLASATLLEAPDSDADGAFADLVGRYVAALDGGDEAADAFSAALGSGTWEPATPPIERT